MTQARHAPAYAGPKVFRLYRLFDADGRLLYIGQTGRMPLVRCIEHLIEQAWGGDVARWELDPQIFHSEAEVLAAEEAAIRAEKPLRNWIHNEGPHRQWQPKVTEYRHPGSRAPRIDPVKPSRQPARKPLSAKARRRRKWTLAWAGTVAMLWAALVLLDAAWLHWPVPVLDWLDLSAGGVTALYVKLHVGRKKRRKLAWALIAMAMVAAALLIAKG